MEEARPLRDLLERAGPLPSSQARGALGVSKATLSRWRRALGDQVIVHGRARATMLALRRPIDGLRAPLPVYEVDADGRVHPIVTLHPVEPFGHRVEAVAPGAEEGFFEADPRSIDGLVDLPWFLQDLKPDGFLARAWLRRHPELGFPAELSRWTGDDVLRFSAHHGAEGPGAWLTGPLARLAFLEGRQASDPVPVDQLAEELPSRAERATEQPVGSSPGGEQPKLTVSVLTEQGVKHLIVKVSPPVHSPGGRRWADLLVAESLAHQVVAEAGHAASSSWLVDAGGRRFLCVERFDRIGERGRAGVVSLRPFDHGGVATDLRRWSVAVDPLAREGVLSGADADAVRWLEAFGHAIANTDMHLGNLSLRLQGTRVTGLAPVYDMLPMFHAPRHGGELHPGLYDARGELEQLPRSVAEAARELWRRVADHEGVSRGFQEVASGQAELLVR